MDTLESVVKWSTIAANIVTVLGIIGAFIAFYKIVRNRVSSKSFKAKLEIKNVCFWNDKICLSSKLSFENYTDKEFSVLSAWLCYEKREFQILYQPAPKKEFQPVENLPFYSHSSMTFNETFILIPYDLVLTSASIKIKTTVGEFVYGVDVRQTRQSIENLNK